MLSLRRGGEWHMKGVGMLVGNFELNPERGAIWTPKRDHVKTHSNRKKVTFNDGKDIIIKYFYPWVVFKSIVTN